MLLACAVLALVAATDARALINPSFTPLHLTRQSDHIVFLQAGAVNDEGSMSAKVVEEMKGKAPSEELALRSADEFLLERIREEVFYEEPESVDALMFLSNPEGGGPARSGVISLGGMWFGVVRREADGPWMLIEDMADMKAVWDGRTDMLRGCVRYILADPDAVVPVRAGAQWAEKVQLGRVEGSPTGVLAVDLEGGGLPTLFVATDGGDRAFRCKADGEAFEDVTASLKLAGKSRCATFADCTGDGRLDLACWDGAALRVLAQSQAGTFEKAAAELSVEGECIGLSPLDAGLAGRAGILLSTRAVPTLILPQESGALFGRELVETAEGEFAGAELGLARACVAADFDGDSIVDVVQPFEEGGLFYKGEGGGAFAAPKQCGYLYSGEGEASAYPGDFDADGRLDLIFMGEMGQFLWVNRSGGAFENNWHVGEPDYIAKENNSGGAVGDFNSDGRQDFVIFYRRVAPHPFFSRGFATFGFAAEMDVVKGDFFGESVAGQRGGVLVDLNGDGAQDLVTVLTDGTVWAVLRALEYGPGLSVRAGLASGQGTAGPVAVTGWDGVRCLGAWSVTAGISDAFFARERPGPVTLKWRFPGGVEQEARVILESGPVRVLLGRDGIVRAGQE